MADEPVETPPKIALPPGVEKDDELEIDWSFGCTVTVKLGDAEIIVRTMSEEAADMIPWLIAALPNALEQAWAAMEAAEKEES